MATAFAALYIVFVARLDSTWKSRSFVCALERITQGRLVLLHCGVCVPNLLNLPRVLAELSGIELDTFTCV